MGRLDGKVAIITGAGAGMGRLGAQRFAEEGAHVVVADLDPDAVAETVRLVVDGGGEAIGSVVDVSDGHAVEAMVATATDAWGHIADDVLLLARPEIAELAEPAAEGRGGSSTMPQKANPVLSVLVRRAALSTPGLAAQLHTANRRPKLFLRQARTWWQHTAESRTTAHCLLV